MAVSVFLVALWYIFGTIGNIQSKKFLSVFPSPLMLTLGQYCAGVILSSSVILLLGQASSSPAEDKSQPIMKGRSQSILLLVCLLNGVGHLMTNLSLGAVAVSFTQTVKAAEPLFAVVISAIVLGSKPSAYMVLSLLPIVIGIGIATTTELSYTHLGMLTAMASNLLFSTRNIYSKKLQDATGLGSWFLCLYLCTSGIVLLGFFFLINSVIGWPLPQPMESAWLPLLVSSMCHAIGNSVSFLVLERISPLTHAVGGAMRRIFMIFCAVMWFHTPVSAINIIGSVLASFGVLLYSRASLQHRLSQQRLPSSKKDDFLSL